MAMYVTEQTATGVERLPLSEHFFLGDTGRILLNTPINADTANEVRETLLRAAELGKTRVTLELNSPGGSVIDGLAILDTMDEVRRKGVQVDTCACGMAASMAAVILASGDERSAYPNSRVLIHQVLGQISGQTTDVLIAAAQMQKDKERLNRILAQKSGKSLEEVTADTERDFYLSPQEALDYGLIDKIL